MRPTQPIRAFGARRRSSPSTASSRSPDHIFQVRGFDVSTVSFIDAGAGWIVVDPLTTVEVARAAFELLTEHVGQEAGARRHLFAQPCRSLWRRGRRDERGRSGVGRGEDHRAGRIPRARRLGKHHRRSGHVAARALPVRRHAAAQQRRRNDVGPRPLPVAGIAVADRAERCSSRIPARKSPSAT